VKAFLSPSGESADLMESIAQRSARLHAAHGSGARFLAVTVRDNREAAEWALSCFHSPLTFVPLAENLPAPARASRLAQLPSGAVITPEELPPAPTRAPQLRPKTEIWAVIFSSGTTGEPKGVALSGAALEASAVAHATHTGAGAACWLLDLPLYHVGGLSVLTRAFFLHTPLALSLAQFSAAATAAWIRSGLVQGISLVPTTLVRLLREPEVPFEKLALILLGGAPALPELVSEARARKAPLRLTYGMTEHASQIATEKSAGLEPLPKVELKIEQNEILVCSPALASGYFQNGELRLLPLRSGFFPTGDLGELREGRLHILGRASEIIITGGKKVFPAEVEAALSAMEGVKECAVMGLPDSEWGELVVAAIVGTASAAQLKAGLKQKLEGFKVPKRFVRVSSIPRTPSGKVMRHELREWLQAQS
jgi:O-succinylbenzoic acid--CoA ligase